MIRLGALGDVVRTLPAVARLRRAHPEARLAWLVESRAAGALRALDVVDDVIVFPREALVAALRRGRFLRATGALAAFVRSLRAARFDVVLDFHGILKSGLLAAASGARRRLGYARPLGREGSWLFATHRAHFDRSRMTRFERNAGLVACWLGEAEVAAPEPPRLAPDAERRAALEAVVGGGAPIALLHAGSSAGTPYKRMPAHRLADVAQRLARQGLRVLVLAGPDPHEQAEARGLVEAAGAGVALAPPTPELADLLALVSLAVVFVGADSAPLHTAALADVPSVQLVGPTDPFVNQPSPQGRWAQVRGEAPCSPCRRGCAEALCMQRIEPAKVIEAVERLREGGVSNTASRAVGAPSSAARSVCG